MWYITQSRSSILLGDRHAFLQILFLISPNQCRVSLRKQLTFHNATGLSLSGRGQGFPPATKNMAPDHFRRKIGEKYNWKKSLAVWLSAYLLYLPPNLRSWWEPWCHHFIYYCFPAKWHLGSEYRNFILTVFQYPDLNSASNRPCAWWGHFTTPTRILLGFAFLYKLGLLLFK